MVIGARPTQFVWKVAISDPKAYEKFAESIIELPEVQECHHVIGEFDYIIKVKTRDTASLEDLISNHIRRIDGVGRTLTTVALSSLKETSTIELDAGEKKKGKKG